MLGLIETDIDIIEVDGHISYWCDSGHKAPPLFSREGPDTPELPTRFFHIRVKNSQINGVYCEACLIVANYQARLKKQGKL